MPDDRDVRRPKTPPQGVKAALEEEFAGEELTPIFGDPFTQTAKRATQAAAGSRAAWKAIRKVEDDVAAGREEIRQYAEKDQLEHKAIRETLSGVQIEIGNVKTEVKAVATHVGDLRENVALMTGRLEGLTDAIQEDRATKRAETDFRLKRRLAGWRSIFRVLAAVAAAVGVGIAGHLLGKYLGG